MSDWIARPEAVKLYGVPFNTLRLWESEGKLKARRENGRVFYSRKDIENLSGQSDSTSKTLTRMTRELDDLRARVSTLEEHHHGGPVPN